LAFFVGSGCKARSATPATVGSNPADSSAAPRAPVDMTGIVVDRRGAPLADALVIAWPKDKRGEAVAQARTDEDGRFLLPLLRPDRWMLLVETGGLGTLETERQVPEDGPARLMLDGEGRSLTGTVVDTASRPVFGAEVTLGSPGLRWRRVARTDANGIFAIRGLGAGRFTLRAERADHASVPAVVTFDEGITPPAHVRLELRPGVGIEGRVVDDTGQPLPGATVDVMSVPSDDLPVSGQAGRDGRFRLGPVAPARYQILARFGDYVLLDAPEPQIGARTKESFELRMARPARVSGRVLDESGWPMAGVQVSVISLIGGRDDLVVIPGALPLAAEAAELPIGRLLRPGGIRSCPTDKSGKFAITGLSPGRARLEIQHPDKLPLRREPLLLVPGDAREEGDLTLVTGATLAGRVIDEEERPVEGAWVEARLVDRQARPALRTTTDGKGEFFIRLPLGDYTIKAETHSLVSLGTTSLRIRSDVSSDSCLIRLAPRVGTPPKL
jgi:protocatechuate 3,4-dioxygenase beta subunit